jgi:hypothetical protein
MAPGESAACRPAVKALGVLLANAQRPISKAHGGVSPGGGSRVRWPSFVAGKTTLPCVVDRINSVGPDRVWTWRVAALDPLRHRHAENTAPKAKMVQPTTLD